MARNDTANSETPVDEQTSENGEATAAANGKPKRAKTSQMIPVTLPLDLYELVAEKAKQENQPATGLARKLLADYVGYTKPIVLRSRTKKYETDEERKAAQADKYQKARALMLALEAGAISPEVLAQFEAVVKAEKEAKAKNAPAEAATA